MVSSPSADSRQVQRRRHHRRLEKARSRTDRYVFYWLSAASTCIQHLDIAGSVRSSSISHGLTSPPTRLKTNTNTGTRPEKIRIQKWYTVYKDHITLADYEIHDGMGLELYYN